MRSTHSAAMSAMAVSMSLSVLAAGAGVAAGTVVLARAGGVSRVVCPVRAALPGPARSGAAEPAISGSGEGGGGGEIETVAGGGRSLADGVPATRALLYPGGAGGTGADSAGNVLVADSGNNTVRVAAAVPGVFYGRRMKAGDIYTVAGTGVAGFSGDGGPAVRARLSFPEAVVVDRCGNLLVSDTGNGRVRFVPARPGTFYGRRMRAGHIYTVAGGGTSQADGEPATQASMFPGGIVADQAGNLVVDDNGNPGVRVVAVAAGWFYGRRMRAGHIYTVAGGGTSLADGVPATAALLSPYAVWIDHAGNLLVPDRDNGRVRVVAVRPGRFYGQPMKADDIYTVAGNGQPGFSGDGGPAIKAGLGGQEAIAVDRAGNLILTDINNNRVRVVAVRPGRFYGQPMKAGDIYTVAGNGQPGFSGDGGPAVRAEFGALRGVAVAGGNLLIGDTGNGRVREIEGCGEEENGECDD